MKSRIIVVFLFVFGIAFCAQAEMGVSEKRIPTEPKGHPIVVQPYTSDEILEDGKPLRGDSGTSSRSLSSSPVGSPDGESTVSQGAETEPKAKRLRPKARPVASPK